MLKKQKNLLRILFQNYFAKKNILLIILPIILLLILLNINQNKRYIRQSLIFGALAEIQIISSNDKKANQAFDKCFKELERLENNLSIFREGSEVYKINHRTSPQIKVTQELYDLLKYSCDISEKTNNAFDITVYPLIELWKKSEKENNLPSDSEIIEIKKQVGYKNIEFLDNNIINFKNNIKIDLGGIAAGYGIDKIVQILYNNNIKNFLINIGGDIFASGHDEFGHEWRIGVQDPASRGHGVTVLRTRGSVIKTFDIHNRAIVTSGDYEKYFEINGKKYSHIIDPRTGRPAEGSLSITILAPTTIYADAISTAVSVMGKNEAERFLKDKKEIESYLVFGNG